ncbi:hypothetical protein SELMODRAFT_151094 [Selaginella moellendorffii]|uniref:S-formylglutathione hydrolase n=2 Tax=Selaginella moellendorffii TaxID=88036 RepID=D8RYN9_SELML|nr:S-formylglutathione hydrolase isoform X1 [Selaginella moellendorffii]EFJ22464.1 hypothetical protein SELMODRAFT_151094 [Selaginella moellendorffii]|eukprot:XP_002976204.1 S-formylglutathione hydrolase isoform X1 [Selaginella moellendorffii]
MSFVCAAAAASVRISLRCLATKACIEQLPMAQLKEIGKNKMFGGFNRRFQHPSSSCGCDMNFSVYFPPAADHGKVPVLYWLSGLTCTDENFIQKSGVQRVAAAEGVAIVCPDTSPRGLGVEGESDSWDFGVGAGFYLNATQEKWKKWRMYDYCTKELPELLSSSFDQLDTKNASIFGHSMGGHGALTIFLKNPDKYKSVSAFAPIASPVNCPWGQKAFSGYLGDDKSLWEEYDASLLSRKYKGNPTKILIDQGDDDKFYKEKQLLPENIVESELLRVELHLRSGYDHSYFFIASFVEDHIKMHATALKS